MTRLRFPIAVVIAVAVCSAPRAPGDLASALAKQGSNSKTNAEEKAFYSNGALKFRVPLNAKGQRHGEYVAYFEVGKKLQERASYANGVMSGARQTYDVKGQLVTDELWIHGILALPRSERVIQATRAQILKEASASIDKMGRITNSNAPSKEALAKALGRVNFARSLAGLPDDVALDDSYINLCQYASELLSKIGHLTHTPEKPAGYDEKAYELGRDGCGHSNIYVSSGGGRPVASVDGYMNDSDASNIDRLGHRRWILNPSMGKTGFGSSGKYSAMYSMDHSRSNSPEYDYVCWPPRGMCPMDMFADGYAWHVTVNPAKYKVTEQAAIQIQAVDETLKPSGKPTTITYAHIDRGGFGVSNAIIAKPASGVVHPGVVYQVSVTGVQQKDGQPAEIQYFVAFYSPAAER